MLDYEWGNAAAVLLSTTSSVATVEEPTTTQIAEDQYRQIFHPYDHSPNFTGDDFIHTQSATTVSAADYTGYPCSLSLQPTGAERLGLNLNLGVRTYFPSSSPETELVRPGRVYRRPNGNGRVGFGVYGGGGGVIVVKCQVEGCGADLTHTKHYYRRHKVCEFHSKAPTAVAQGLTQRFCQQCSRFHLLAEFDQGKRSCRKRLADHNRRRRKSQPEEPRLPPPLLNPNADPIPPISPNFTAKSSAEGSSRGSLPPVSLTRMALGSCFRPQPGAAGARLVPGSNTSSCTPTSSSSSRSSSNSLLPYVSDLRPSDRRVPVSSWYDHEKAHYQQ